MASRKLNVLMFLGSVREGRMATRVAKFIDSQLKTKYELEVFDPSQIQLPLLKMPLHFYQNQAEAPQILRECETKLKTADAFIIVTTEYNTTIPPALSNLLSHFGSNVYSYKPSGIVSYSLGIYAGMRAAMNLRCLLSELGTYSIPNIFGIPQIDKALSEDGKPLNDFMIPGLERMVAQLDWHAHAMKNHRDKCGVPK